MAASKLKLYNGALREIGERKLSSLTENIESRRVLDTAYDNDFIDFILGEGQWNFALRTGQIDIDASITTSFGYTNAFSKPTDWIRTVAVSEDEYFYLPLRQYKDEAGYWYAESDPLYVQWVSNGEDYGADFSAWPANFFLYAQTVLASLVCTRLTQNEQKTEKLEALARRRAIKARSTDAMDDPSQSLPPGSWQLARHTGGRNNKQRRSD
jgi:hypothetical protein